MKKFHFNKLLSDITKCSEIINNIINMQVERESKTVGLEREDALNRARWRVGIGEIAVRMG